MYAVIKSGCRQYRVEPGQIVEVDRLGADPGQEIVFDDVLLAGGEGGTRIGTPVIAGAKVVGEVLDERRDRKVVVFKYKAKERYRVKSSQRRWFTRVRINDIIV